MNLLLLFFWYFPSCKLLAKKSSCKKTITQQYRLRLTSNPTTEIGGTDLQNTRHDDYITNWWLKKKKTSSIWWQVFTFVEKLENSVWQEHKFCARYWLTILYFKIHNFFFFFTFFATVLNGSFCILVSASP